jgi:hypothetical protein
MLPEIGRLLGPAGPSGSVAPVLAYLATEAGDALASESSETLITE